MPKRREPTHNTAAYELYPRVGELHALGVRADVTQSAPYPLVMYFDDKARRDDVTTWELKLEWHHVVLAEGEGWLGWPDRSARLEGKALEPLIDDALRIVRADREVA